MVELTTVASVGTLSSLFFDLPSEFQVSCPSCSLFILLKGNEDLLRLGPTRTSTELKRNCDCFRLNGEHPWSFLPFHNVAFG